MDKFLSSYGISKERFIELCKDLKDGATPDSLMFTLNILKNKYRLAPDTIAYLAGNCFGMISDKDFVRDLSRLQARFGIYDSRVTGILSSWRAIHFSVKSIDYLIDLQKEVGLTPQEMLSAICYSKIPYSTPRPNHVKRAMEILDVAGLKRENLARGISVLNCKPRRIADILMLGMVQGYDINDFVTKNYHRFQAGLVYARLRAERAGLIPKGLVYASDEDFLRNSNGISNQDLMNRFIFGPLARLEIQKEFLEKFPEKTALLEEDSKELLNYLNQKNQQISEGNPENEKGNRQVLLDSGIYWRKVEELIDAVPELRTIDSRFLKYNLSVLQFLLSESGRKYKAINANPELITNSDNRLYKCFKQLNQRYGMTRAEFCVMLNNIPTIVNEFVDEDEIAKKLEGSEKFFKENYGFSDEDCKNILMRAGVQFLYYDEVKVVDKIEMLKAFGVGAKTIAENARVLSSNIGALEIKLKLAMLNGLPMEAFVGGSHCLSQNKVYARMRGVADGVIAENAVYYSNNRFNALVDSGKALSQEQLMDKYVLDYNGILKISSQFKEAFPEIQAKLDENRQALIRKASQVFEDKPDDYKLENFKRRIMRICSLTGEQVAELIRNIGKIVPDNFTDIIMNFYNLKEMGFAVDDIIKMPRVLKTKHEDTKIKAMLSNLLGKSNEQFLRRNYTYSAETVYAKMAESQEMGVAPLNIYDANEAFEKSINRRAGVNATVNFLKTLHPLDDSARLAIQQQYDQKIYCEKISESNCLEVGEDE